MSSQVHAETTLLLDDAQRTGQGGARWAPETLVIPVVFATKLGNLVSTTTFIEVVRQAVCKRSVMDPSVDPIFSDPCDAPTVAQTFSTAIAVYGVVEGLMAIAGCGVLNRMSSHHGRKPALLCLFVSGTIASALVPWSQYAPDWLADWVLLLGVLLQLFSGPLSFSYLINTYIVDVCPPEDRTAALSKISGWAALGTCIPVALGGSITTRTGNSFIVFHIATVTFVSAFTYVVAVLPESFPIEKRHLLSVKRSARSDPSRTHPLVYVVEPLRLLVPAYTSSGIRSWRITLCALHTFVYMSVNAYALPAWLVLASSKYHLTPADTGFFYGVVTASATVTLTLIAPVICRLRTLQTSFRSDVYLASLSSVLEGVAFLCAAESMITDVALILSGILIGSSAVHMPVIRNLVAGSVDPLEQGEALAAIEMVISAGAMLSPIVMGSVLTATIDGTPTAVFHIHLVVVVVSAALLLGVRDERVECIVRPYPV